MLVSRLRTLTDWVSAISLALTRATAELQRGRHTTAREWLRNGSEATVRVE